VVEGDRLDWVDGAGLVEHGLVAQAGHGLAGHGSQELGWLDAQDL